MKYTKKYQNVGTIPKFVQRGKIDTPNTQIHDLSFSWLGTTNSIQSGGFKTSFMVPNSPLGEMVPSCINIPYCTGNSSLLEYFRDNLTVGR
jgi:hypothetical protein